MYIQAKSYSRAHQTLDISIGHVHWTFCWHFKFNTQNQIYHLPPLSLFSLVSYFISSPPCFQLPRPDTPIYHPKLLPSFPITYHQHIRVLIFLKFSHFLPVWILLALLVSYLATMPIQVSTPSPCSPCASG